MAASGLFTVNNDQSSKLFWIYSNYSEFTIVVQLTIWESILYLCNIYLIYFTYIIEVYSEPCETSKIEHFSKTVNGRI